MIYVEIPITRYMESKSFEFAEASVDSSIDHYNKRNVTSRSRIVHDIFIGKVGEFAAYNYLKSLGLLLDPPDTTVYQKGKKSFSADLTVCERKYHCKSQGEDSVDRYGISWILQYGGNGRGHTDKLFRKRDDNDFLIPMTIHEKHVRIYGIVSLNTIFDKGMIEMPKCDWFKDTKRAIYNESIQKLTESQLWSGL